jgi:hypothetical protein
MKKFIITTIAIFGSLLNPLSVYAQDITITIQKPSNVKITDFGKLIGSVVGIALTLATIAAFLFLIWGGIQWITSGGDKAGVETAQHRIQAALLGLLIVFSIWALFTVVGNFLGINPFNLTLPSAAN